MRRSILRGAAWAALLASAAGAQTFEVASVKPALPGSRSALRGGPGTNDPGRIAWSGITLQSLLAKAYGIQNYQISGPTWLEDARYEIVASLPPGTTGPELQQMLRSLLAERFHLTEHRETRELPIYALEVARNGARLKESGSEPEAAAGDGPQVTTVSLARDGYPVMPPGYKGRIIGMKLPGKTMLRAKGESLDDFAKVLTDLLDRPVFDHTGLTGKYDFGVAWSEDQAMPRDSNQALEPGPDVFSAMQTQLGLRLDPRKAPIEMLVVDHVARDPTAN